MPSAPPRAPKAVLFDLDGTLVDSEPLHAESTNRVLAPYGARLEPADFLPYVGWSEEPFWHDLQRRFDLPVEPTALLVARTAEYLGMLHEASLEPLPGVSELLDGIERASWPCAVASSSPRAQIEASLRAAGLAERLTVHRSGHEDVERGKPAPDVYLAAADAIGVDAADCLAVEDSATGVQAARAAGALVVAIPCPSHPAVVAGEAHHTFPSATALLSWLVDKGWIPPR